MGWSNPLHVPGSGGDAEILKGDIQSCPPGRILGHVDLLHLRLRKCDYCRRGMYSHCTTGGWILGNQIDGTQAEYVRTPHADTSLYRIPTAPTRKLLAMLSDILPTGFECGVLNGKVQPAEIIMVDFDDHRLRVSKRLGATVTFNSADGKIADTVLQMTGGRGIDTAIEAVGVPASFNTCEDIVAPGGTIANVGVHGSKVDLHLERLWARNITITTRLVDTVTIPMLLKTVQSHSFGGISQSARLKTICAIIRGSKRYTRNLSAKNKKRQAAEVVSSKRARTLAAAAFLSRHSRTIALFAVAIASARIVATYTVFNQTFDEPLHIGCGIEWLSGVICADETPPLARVAEAIGPYLLGARSTGAPYQNMDSEYTAGSHVLYRTGSYDLTLALARLGNLPFFWIACLVVYLWGQRYYGAGVAAAAVVLFSFLPPVLAHAGVATVDMALTALLGAASLAALAWLERPNATRGALFGATAALAILSKYSALVFLPAVLALALALYGILERPGVRRLSHAAVARLPSFGIVLVTAAVLIWAAYRFSYGATTWGNLRLPAPQLFSGLKMVADHNKEGHYAFLLGQRSTTGWWYFYLVALAVKTPLAFLGLVGFGSAMTFREMRSGTASHGWIPLAFSCAILIVGMSSQINVGLRHILPVYIGFSVVAGMALMRMLELGEASNQMCLGLAVLLVWMAVSSLKIHPDYLAYFNELAGSHPENVLVDSDLDWGQDMKRLSQRLREVGAPFVTFTPLADPDLPQVLGFPPVRASDVPIPSTGWNAVSLTQWKSRRLRLLNTHPEVVAWPNLAPPGERVGRGIMLWYFPPGSIPGR